MRAVAFILALGGCGFSVGGGVGADGGAGGDSGSLDGDPVVGDAGIDAAFGCYGRGIVRVCFHEDPPPEIRYTAAMVINTDAPDACMTAVSGMNVTGACVIAAHDLKIEASVTATGARPLIFVALDDLTVSAKIDVGSRRGGSTGPGATSAICQAGEGATVGFSGGGGGAGGSFMGLGGAGGSADGGDPGPVTLDPTVLRGGCPGVRGASTVGAYGAGGAGGGALVLIAGDKLDINSVISAVGQSGQGGQFSLGAGGGGGGSGGMVLLDGATVMLSGEVNANGGGGGEGSDNAPGGDGMESSSATIAGAGGTGGNGGDGGSGSVGTTRTGGAGKSQTGGGGVVAGAGGGGGGAGFIKVYGTSVINALLSPPAS